MNEKINLKDIERKAYLSYHEDGLLDIFLATFLIQAAISTIFVESFWIFATSGTWFVFYFAIKQAITIPRIGQVNFSSARKGKIKRTTLTLVILGTVSVIINLAFFSVLNLG